MLKEYIFSEEKHRHCENAGMEDTIIDGELLGRTSFFRMVKFFD